MAWSSPKTWVTGYKVLAADMNQFVSDNDSALLEGAVARNMDTLDGIATGSAPAVSPSGDSRVYHDSTLNRPMKSRNGGSYLEYIPRVLDSRTGTPFGYTDADTAEKVIWSAALPAGTLATNGDVLEFSCAGNTLATAANHQLFVRVSGTKIFSTQDVDLGNCSWVMRGTIVRQTSVYGQLMVHYDQSTAVDNVRCREDNIAATTWADAQTFEISAQNGASVQYGVQIRVAQITLFPAAI